MTTAEKHKAEYEDERWSTARPNCHCSFCEALRVIGRQMSRIMGMD